MTHTCFPAWGFRVLQSDSMTVPISALGDLEDSPAGLRTPEVFALAVAYEMVRRFGVGGEPVRARAA